MAEQWQYQVRIDVSESVGETLRSDPTDATVAPVAAILRRHDAKAICQYDAFAGYCAEAEREGIEQYPLYDWTKATIEDPAKKAKYLKSFTLYVDGEQVYPKDEADALEAELRPLVGGGICGQAAQVRHQSRQQPAAAGALPQLADGAADLRGPPRRPDDLAGEESAGVGFNHAPEVATSEALAF